MISSLLRVSFSFAKNQLNNHCNLLAHICWYVKCQYVNIWKEKQDVRPNPLSLYKTCNGVLIGHIDTKIKPTLCATLEASSRLLLWKKRLGWRHQDRHSRYVVHAISGPQFGQLPTLFISSNRFDAKAASHPLILGSGPVWSWHKLFASLPQLLLLNIKKGKQRQLTPEIKWTGIRCEKGWYLRCGGWDQVGS